MTSTVELGTLKVLDRANVSGNARVSEQLESNIHSPRTSLCVQAFLDLGSDAGARTHYDTRVHSFRLMTNVMLSVCGATIPSAAVYEFVRSMCAESQNVWTEIRLLETVNRRILVQQGVCTLGLPSQTKLAELAVLRFLSLPCHYM